jgi:hypothetical protein
MAALVENRIPAALRSRLEVDIDLTERLDYKAGHARVLLALREDFLHQLERWRRMMPSLMENRLELRMLSGPQAFQAVVRPGQLRPGLPAIIPDEVGRAIVRFVAGAGAEVPLEEIDAVPPLLSLVCAELNAQRLASAQPQVSQAQFEGSSSDILESFYLRSFELPTYGGALDAFPDAGSALQQARCLIEDRLLSPDGFRESIAFDTIERELSGVAGPETAKAVLGEIVQRRLLTLEERGGVRRIELAHDVLTKIVKVSRDERRELETVAKARADQERAEAETARVLQERNRLKRLAVLAFCLAVAALGSTFWGWGKLRESKEATRSAEAAGERAVEAKTQAEEAEMRAVTARNQAQAGFESAWTGLTSLYQDYTARTLEDTPGISRRLANSLKSDLRAHLLDQLRKLHQEQPDHAGTIRHIARLLLDEGREAIADGDYTRADKSLVDALEWTSQRPLDTVEDAETRAEILLEQARVSSNAGDQRKGKEVALLHRPKVQELVANWPDSWRLKYVIVRLENVIFIAESTTPRPEKVDLAARLLPLVEVSNLHFDPVIWYFVIQTNSFRGEDVFQRTEEDYRSVKAALVWFRENVLETDFPDRRFTHVQLESGTEHLVDLLWFVRGRFAEENRPGTLDERRAILTEFETIMGALERRLPKSTVVYGARLDLLALQEAGILEGVNTRSPEELADAVKRHRMGAAALGVASSVADLIGPAFKTYTADDADTATKALALRTVQNSNRDFMSLDLVGVDTVLRRNDIVTNLEKLQAAGSEDPLLAEYNMMVEQYVQLYSQAGVDSKVAMVNTLAKLTEQQVKEWFEAVEYGRIADFRDRVYADLPFRTLISGELDSLIRGQNYCATSLIRSGRVAEGRQLLEDIYALSQNILADRPWDWYVRTNTNSLCFDGANALHETGNKEETQLWLRRGWEMFKEYYGDDIDLDGYSELPLRGDVPENISAGSGDARFFEQMQSYEVRGEKQSSGMKRFTIPCDFGGEKFPFHIYVNSGKKSYERLCDQFRWLEEYRGGKVPVEVQDSFRRLHEIAVENNVNYMDLCVYALGTAAAEETPQEQLDAAIEALKKCEEAYSNEKNDANRSALSAAYNTAAFRGLFLQRWTDAEAWARSSIELDRYGVSVPFANLATALLFQDRYDQALEIYRAYWRHPYEEKIIGDAVLADFEALAKAGVTHPDVARIKEAFGVVVAGEPAETDGASTPTQR